MGTHAKIYIKEETGLLRQTSIFKYWDGNVGNILPTLKSFTEKFYEKRGLDYDYLLPQIIRVFAMNDFIKVLESGHTNLTYDHLKNHSINRTEIMMNDFFFSEELSTGWAICNGIDDYPDSPQYSYVIDFQDLTIKAFEGDIETLIDKITFKKI